MFKSKIKYDKMKKEKENIMTKYNEEIKYVYSKIKEGNYEVLSNDIAIGKVYKITSYGNLNKDGFELGYLYLKKGSGIKEHYHEENIERYQLLHGNLIVSGENCTQNICLLHQKHSIQPVHTDTIIQTFKINSLYYHKLSDISKEEFNKLISFSKIKKKN